MSGWVVKEKTPCVVLNWGWDTMKPHYIHTTKNLKFYHEYSASSQISLDIWDDVYSLFERTPILNQSRYKEGSLHCNGRGSDRGIFVFERDGWYMFVSSLYAK